MNALVVYESLWGNTKAIAEAVARGLGAGATAACTSDATLDKLAAAELLVAGSPLLGFDLPTDTMRHSIGANPAHADHPADLSRQSMREWISELPKGNIPFASFETRIWWSPGSAARKIASLLEAQGFRRVGKPEKFLVTGTYGPLKDGELARAEQWGRQLAEETSVTAG